MSRSKFGRISNRQGFTLIELVIVMAILAILASAIAPLGHIAKKRSMELELKQNLRLIRNALDAYKKAYDEKKIENEIGVSGYPKNLRELVEGVKDVKDSEGRMIYFLRRIPKDPMNRDEFLAPEETWEIRSYESEPDDFSGGDDVYDIRSTSDEIALDGTPYKEW